MPLTLRVLLLIGLCGLPGASQAVLIGSYSRTIAFDVGVPPIPAVRIDVCTAPGFPDGLDPCSFHQSALFRSLLVTTADDGATFVSTPQNNAEFAAAASLLTNGTDDRVAIVVTFDTGASSGVTVPDSFLSGTGEDFAGFELESVELVLDDFRLLEADHICNGCIEWDGTLTLRVFGAVIPEPSTAMLLFIGLGLVSRIPRRSARSG